MYTRLQATRNCECTENSHAAVLYNVECFITLHTVHESYTTATYLHVNRANIK